MLGVAALTATSAAANGPKSQYFLGANTKIIRAQGENYISAPTLESGQYPLAVNGSIRIVYSEGGEIGHEYTLDLVPTGKMYTNSAPPPDDLWDATTDGCFIYAVNVDTGEVVRFKLNWKGYEVMFDLGDAFDYLGITYDPTDQTLWVARYSGGTTIEHYTMKGNFISSFDVGHDHISALALDHRDGTLWFGDGDDRGVFRQYSKDGTMLT